MQRNSKWSFIFHVTFNPKFRRPYFEEDIYSLILSNVLDSGQSLKCYDLIAYKINPDHIHVLIKVWGRFNLRSILHHVKRVSSVRLNVVRSYGTEDERPNHALDPELEMCHNLLAAKYGSIDQVPHPLFQWQSGFNKTTILSVEQYRATVAYIKRQAIHHQLKHNHFLYVKPEWESLY